MPIYSRICLYIRRSDMFVYISTEQFTITQLCSCISRMGCLHVGIWTWQHDLYGFYLLFIYIIYIIILIDKCYKLNTKQNISLFLVPSRTTIQTLHKTGPECMLIIPCSPARISTNQIQDTISRLYSSIVCDLRQWSNLKLYSLAYPLRYSGE